MEKLFVWGIVLAALIALFTGSAEETGAALLSGGQAAVALGLSLAGAYCLWCGVLKVMELSGLTTKVALLFRPLLRLLMPGIEQDAEASEAVSLNFAANLLGMGNAATPAGLRAMRAMQKLAGGARLPTEAMCMFLIINSSSLQLVPTTLISLRAAAGSAAPGDILLPALLSTLCTSLLAVGLTFLVQRVGKRSKKGRAA
ncbi:MAG: spore maturation protein [Christensenellaceae bacterium]|jgi:spore maturation protein A|nr:spore maturation protein [Christensenellaceae bacterium]